MKKISAAASARLMTWRPGSVIGLPLMRPESLRKAITEPVKVMAPMATPIDISIRLWGVDVAVGCRCRTRSAHRTRPAATQHRRHADQRVKARDQFRHRGHRHLARDHGADAATEAQARDHQDDGPGPDRRIARRAW